MNTDDADRLERLRRLLGGADLARLRGRVRARYERGDTRDAFTLSELSRAERRALERLLGRSVRAAASMRLRRSELDAAVQRAGLAPSFRAALEALDGPLVDKKAEREARDLAWRRAVDGVRDARLRALVSAADGLGLVKRLSRSDAAHGAVLLERAEQVLAQLPARGMPLARLAADTLGDAHALDPGRPVAALVLSACRSDETRGAPEVAVSEQDRGTPREQTPRRDQWARVGVAVNELAAPALALNLHARGPSPAARLVNAAAEAAAPVHLSLRALLRNEPEWEIPGGDVHVCENSTVVTIAADAIGSSCRPLVCTDGMPAAAQQTLLGQLAAAGARLRYHGDFDWPGIAIGNFVVRNHGAVAWRFSTQDYRAARVDVELALEGERPVEAVWDPYLGAAMTERGVAVHEERVVDSLLADLAG